ncbi:MAG: ATP cone domain-containing protein [Methanobacterium sp.]|jgi:transcriptional repressor NrdR
MTDVIKSTGKKEPFRPEKIRRSIENAITDAGFTVASKMKAIEHASEDAMNLARGRSEVSSKELRNEILNDLESDVPEAAQAWRNFEKQRGMK